ncbi:DEAD/DEAH box helicase [Bacillus sp. FJAT-45037]|uniref:DEAD/DEAH box helicase n=1 Tax=Bacillus sp. FJAT-45037 TaxID=2011007 RepID=UPI000C231144|nr:DEAD/DEAH box helicase [Bacillus sp. FJAT-45037]
MSKQTFESFNLSEETLRALNLLSFQEPTKVQAQVLPHALNKQDIIVQAETGSGKTAAYGIPLCEFVDWEENKPQALILTPTRELAVQAKEDLTNIGRFKRVKTAAIFGRQSFERQKLELKQKNHIVAGTPGRVLDHIKKGTLPISEIRYLILDEADEMLSRGFLDQMDEIISELPTNRLTMLFSATYPERLDEITKSYMKAPIHMDLSSTDKKATIEQSIIEVEEEQKFNLLKEVTIVTNPDSCIIFANTQDEVDHLHMRLEKSKYPCRKLHGGLRQDDRFAVINDFKRGAFRYLIATDVAGRGIDIDNISLVINYDVPEDPENYVHRIGRTGRAGKLGTAITLMTPYEERYVEDIEEFTGTEIALNTRPSEAKVDSLRGAFLKKLAESPELKVDRATHLNKNILKLYFNGGKQKKLRAADFVGTITSIEGVSVDDIGIITIEATASFVEILNGKGKTVLEEMRHRTVKGKMLKVHQAKK